ncbi:MAG: S8 family serine peptidase [Beijerinckiaceae bacterium]
MRRAGFTIIRDGRFTITARGPAALVSDVMGISLAVQARPRPGAFRATQNFTVSYAPPHPKDIFVSPVHSLTVKATATASVDDFIFTPPPLFFAPPDPAPPPHAWSGIDQDGIRRLLQVPQQARGQGVKVGIVDTGFYRHPFYTSNGYDYRPTPTASAPHPEDDSDGHGTAIASNVFAMAPAASVYGFQQTDPPQDAVEEAASAGMDVISCSWGWDFEQSFMPLELAIRDIVAEGKIILFASGNGQQAWPGSMPEVLSIGGVFADDAGQLQASNFASGFISNRYPNRTVPDICGLCGQKPSAVYMMLPCPPGSSMDQFYAGAPYPQGDGTHADDGWVGASGTSSATPQLAGLVALLIEKARSQGKVLTLPAIRDILQRSGVAVQSGNNAQGLAAVGHPNGAVGFGLANAQAALALV